MLAFLDVWTRAEPVGTSPRATQHLVQSDSKPWKEKSTPRSERVNTSCKVSQHLAQSESTPRAERVNTSRRASEHLAQSECLTHFARGGALHPMLAQRKQKARAARGGNGLEKSARFFFLRRLCMLNESKECLLQAKRMTL